MTSHRSPHVLIATEDDALARELAALLLDADLTARRAAEAAAALRQIEEGSFDLLLASADLRGGGATELLEEVARVDPELPLVVIVPDSDVSAGVAAVRAGAADFVREPIAPDELLYVIRKVLKSSECAPEEPPRSLRTPQSSPLIGSSPLMRELARTLQQAAQGIATVLVRGESGSGKELVARQVHDTSPRARSPFVKVHCAALPDNLLESELFGYEKGAFTGAAARKPGRVELAEGGTLFLDEIGDITPATQVKLLRVLQDRQYERLGGTQTLTADVRFVAATHRNLEAMVESGTFRQDLFYRLNVVTLWAPPLRARPDDIEPLALHFCETVSRANGRAPVLLDVDALELLRKQPWPGNVRQLQNFVERLVVLAGGPRISSDHVARELRRAGGPLGFAEAQGFAPLITSESSVMDLGAALRKAERRAIEKALTSAGGNRNVAARLLGISRRSLYYKLQEHGIS